MIRRGSFLSNAWLVTGASAAAIALLVLFLWSMGHRPSARGKTLRLFCAAGMNRPVQAIIDEYERTYGVTVQANYAGTGELMVSLANAGIGGDLFLSADSTTMDEAVTDGFVAEVIPIANVRPVLVIHRQTQEKLEREGKPLASLRDLLRDDPGSDWLRHFKIVLAHEGITRKEDGVEKIKGGAAIGRAGKAIFERHGLWEELERRRKRSDALVSNVGTVLEVAARVSQMEGYVGLVWDATAEAKDYAKHLAIVRFPLRDEDAQQIRIGVLNRSENATAALHFARFLTARDKGLKAFAEHKFNVIPDGDYWEDLPKVHIAAGAMLRPGLEPIIKAFGEREGIDVRTSFLPCGMLVGEMHELHRKQSRNFPDAFVSCDIAFHDKVKDYFGAARTILQNDLVMIVPKGNPKQIKASLDELKRPDLKKIGLPHPEYSALGALIAKALKDLDFPPETYDAKLNPRIHNTPSVDMLVSGIGSLDLAIVGRSNARSAKAHLDVLELEVTGLTATQTFAVARDSRHPYLMERLLRAVTTPESLARFRELGFKTKE